MREIRSISVLERNDGKEGERRLDFLDTLRAFIIFLVIVMHTALAYITPPFPGWVYNPKADTNFFGSIALLLEGPLLMSVMFFIAGYFTMPSLIKYGSLKFIKGKLIRIFIPWVIGAAFIAPLQGCISMHSSGIPGTFLDHVKLFFTPIYWGQNQFWFLGVLFYFFLITAAVYAIFNKRISSLRVRAGKPSILIFIGVILINFGACFLINLYAGAQTWTVKYFLQFQNIKIPLYITFFALGIYAYKKDWFKDGYKPRILPWALIFIPSFLVSYILNTQYALNPSTVTQKLYYNLAFSITVLAYVFLFLAVSRKFMNNPKPMTKNISVSSFAVYIIHMIIVFGVLHLSKNIDIPLIVKYLLQVTIITVSVWVLACSLRKVPGLKKVL